MREIVPYCLAYTLCTRFRIAESAASVGAYQKSLNEYRHFRSQNVRSFQSALMILKTDSARTARKKHQQEQSAIKLSIGSQTEARFA